MILTEAKQLKLIKKLKELGVYSYKCQSFEVVLGESTPIPKAQDLASKVKSELKNIPLESITDELYKDLDQKINIPVLTQTV